MSKHKTDNFILASDINFGNIYCKFPTLSPKPLDNTAPETFAAYGLREAIHRKNLLPFGIFPNGLDPPPCIFGTL